VQRGDRDQGYFQRQIHVKTAGQVPGPVIAKILIAKIESPVAVTAHLLIDGQGELGKISRSNPVTFGGIVIFTTVIGECTEMRRTVCHAYP